MMRKEEGYFKYFCSSKVATNLNLRVFKYTKSKISEFGKLMDPSIKFACKQMKNFQLSKFSTFPELLSKSLSVGQTVSRSQNALLRRWTVLFLHFDDGWRGGQEAPFCRLFFQSAFFVHIFLHFHVILFKSSYNT